MSTHLARTCSTALASKPSKPPAATQPPPVRPVARAAFALTPRTTVALAFYTGMGATEPWINRLTAWCTGRYMHVEVVFIDGPHSVACGVWQGECVFLRPKTFGKTCWEWRAVALSPAQVAAVYRFCATQARRRCAFNRWGLWRSVTPLPLANPGGVHGWFCSELCLTALQQAGVLTHEVPCASTPSDVYAALDTIATYHTASPLVDVRIAQRPLTYRGVGGGGHR